MIAEQPNPRGGQQHWSYASPQTPTDPGLTGAQWGTQTGTEEPAASPEQIRDIAEVPAIEIITTVAVHLMSAAAVKCGLGQEGEAASDLDEARKLINALAGLVVTSASDLGTYHAAPLRDGLRSLQMAFREASAYPDPPGRGPGEALTGSVI